MADQSGDNGGSIVAIFAIVVIAALAIGFFMYGLPRMQQKEQPADGMNIKVELPAPSEDGGEPAPQQ